MKTNIKVASAIGAALVSVVATTLLLVRAYTKPSASVAVSPPLPSIASETFKSHPRDIVQNAVLTRALGIESPNAIAPQLDGMPKGLFAHDQNTLLQRLTIWSFFFKGTLTKLGRVNSPSPVIVFYNPIVDVALIEGCHYVGGVAKCDRMCALPGESMDSFQATRTPPWLQQERPLEALKRNAGSRMGVFERDQPAEATVANEWQSKYCSERLQSQAEARLLDSYSQLAGLDKTAIARAISAYVSKRIRPGATPVSLKQVESADPCLAVLTHLDSYSISSFLSPSGRTSVLFLTPKKTGWYQVTLIVERLATGTLEIRSARILAISSHSG